MILLKSQSFEDYVKDLGEDDWTSAMDDMEYAGVENVCLAFVRGGQRNFLAASRDLGHAYGVRSRLPNHYVTFGASDTHVRLVSIFFTLSENPVEDHLVDDSIIYLPIPNQYRHFEVCHNEAVRFRTTSNKPTLETFEEAYNKLFSSLWNYELTPLITNLQSQLMLNDMTKRFKGFDVDNIASLFAKMLEKGAFRNSNISKSAVRSLVNMNGECRPHMLNPGVLLEDIFSYQGSAHHTYMSDNMKTLFMPLLLSELEADNIPWHSPGSFSYEDMMFKSPDAEVKDRFVYKTDSGKTRIKSFDNLPKRFN